MAASRWDSEATRRCRDVPIDRDGHTAGIPHPERALTGPKSSADALPTRYGVTIIIVSCLICTMYQLVKLWSFDVKPDR